MVQISGNNSTTYQVPSYASKLFFRLEGAGGGDGGFANTSTPPGADGGFIEGEWRGLSGGETVTLYAGSAGEDASELSGGAGGTSPFSSGDGGAGGDATGFEDGGGGGGGAVCLLERNSDGTVLASAGGGGGGAGDIAFSRNENGGGGGGARGGVGGTSGSEGGNPGQDAEGAGAGGDGGDAGSFTDPTDGGTTSAGVVTVLASSAGGGGGGDATILAVSPPEAPTLSVADQTDTSVTLDIGAATDEDGIRVFARLKGGTYEQVGSIADDVAPTTFTVTGLDEASTYEMFVEAFNSAGGNQSNGIITTTDTPPPVNPSVTSVTADGAEVTWTPTDAGNVGHEIRLARDQPAIRFGGLETNDAVDVSAVPSPSGAYTIEFIISPDIFDETSDNDFRDIIRADSGFFILVEENGDINHRVPGVEESGFRGGSVPLHERTKVTCVYNGADRVVMINGEETGRQQVGAGTPTISTLTFANGKFDGLLREVQFYHEALPANTVSTDTVPTVDQSRDLAGYWPLAEIQNGTTPDMSRNDNDGQLVGSPSAEGNGYTTAVGPVVTYDLYETGTYFTNSGYPTTEAEMDGFFDTGNAGVTLVAQDRPASEPRQTNPAAKPTDFLPTNFGLRYEGTLYAPESGTYTFATDSDDASDLFINGGKAAHYYGGHGRARDFTADETLRENFSIALDAGYHSFKTRLQEGAGSHAIVLGWQKPSDASISAIPTSAFARARVTGLLNGEQYDTVVRGVGPDGESEVK